MLDSRGAAWSHSPSSVIRIIIGLLWNAKLYQFVRVMGMLRRGALGQDDTGGHCIATLVALHLRTTSECYSRELPLGGIAALDHTLRFGRRRIVADGPLAVADLEQEGGLKFQVIREE